MFCSGRVTEHIIERSTWPSVSYRVEVIWSARRPYSDHLHLTLPVVLETVLRGSFVFVGETAIGALIWLSREGFKEKTFLLQLRSTLCVSHVKFIKSSCAEPQSLPLPLRMKCSHHSLKAYFASSVEMKGWAFEYPQDPLMPNHEVWLRAFSIPDSGNQSEKELFFLSPGAGGPHGARFSWLHCTLYVVRLLNRNALSQVRPGRSLSNLTTLVAADSTSRCGALRVK